MDQMTPSLAVASLQPPLEAQAIHRQLPHVVGKVPPFGVYPLARHYRILVDEWNFADGISGCLIHCDFGYCMGINRNHSPARRRFSAAHELYHYLEHRHLLPNAICMDKHTPLTAKYEREADRFAAELLMPEAWVWHYSGRMYLREMALMFGVSMVALCRRIDELEIPSTYRWR